MFFHVCNWLVPRTKSDRETLEIFCMAAKRVNKKYNCKIDFLDVQCFLFKDPLFLHHIHMPVFVQGYVKVFRRVRIHFIISECPKSIFIYNSIELLARINFLGIHFILDFDNPYSLNEIFCRIRKDSQAVIKVYWPIAGLVDGHTHPVWAGDRVNEFAMKVGFCDWLFLDITLILFRLFVVKNLNSQL